MISPAIDWFVPPERLAAGAESARRARAIVGFCFTGFIANVAFATIYWFTLAPEARSYAAGAIGAFGFVVLVELMLGRRWWRVHAGGLTLYACLALALCVVVWATGGSDSPALWWYLLLPMFALIDWSPRQFLAAVLCGAGLIVGWHFLDTDVHPFGHAISQAEYRSVRFLVQIGVFCVIAAMTYAYAVSKEAAMRAIALTNRELARAGEEAIAANSVKSAFLANMSHEIRTPLTAILGFTDATIEDFEVGSEKWNWLDIVRRNGQHLLELINDILDLSRIEADKLELEHTRFSPCELIAEVASLMQARAEASGVDLQVRFDTPLPVEIRTDPRRVRQILINLVGNAIKFTEAGTITLSAALARDVTPTHLTITVADTGIGMTEAQVLGLFAPFSQGDRSTSRKYGGSGLGLAISQSLAQKLGGAISVESKPGVGSTFVFSIPTGVGTNVACVTRSLESIHADMRAQSERSAAGIGQCAGRRVLLAEDGRDNQILISLLLRRAGATVMIVGNGEQAVEHALEAERADHAFDVVLMDMQMPVLDGHAATRTLRMQGYRHRIVALTANAMAGDRERCLAAGCDDFLAKPIDKDTLLTAVGGSGR